eukprot:325825-Lingulodinium_polyedra.AAC.1
MAIGRAWTRRGIIQCRGVATRCRRMQPNGRSALQRAAAGIAGLPYGVATRNRNNALESPWHCQGIAMKFAMSST